MLIHMKVPTAKLRPKSYKLADASSLFLLVAPSRDKLWRWNYSYDDRHTHLVHGGNRALEFESRLL
jgi:hypothetical protein